MKNLNTIKKLININRDVLRQEYKLKNIGIFGSYARGKARKDSDLDVLVEFYDSPDLFKFINLEYFLGKICGVKVDLVTKKALKPLIKKEVLNQTIYI